MAAIDALRKQWREEARFRPFRSYLRIDDTGLSLGAGTRLAAMAVNREGAPVLALDGEEARILATLLIGFRQPIPITALKFIKRASMQWARGEKALAHFELAYARPPRFETREDARSLFYADGYLRLGISPYALMLARGIDTSQLDLLKFNPTQPRVPAGNPDGGQWTRDGGTAAAGHADTKDDTAASPSPDVSDAIPFIRPIANTGRAGYPIDLREEEQRGGHTIEPHVGKSNEYLLSRLRDAALAIRRLGNTVQGLYGRGSFSSLDAANRLVNSTIAGNRSQVDLVIRGLSSSEDLDASFRSPTGYEAYAKTERSTPYIRTTYRVHVVVVPSLGSPRGYRVLTAYPTNW